MLELFSWGPGYGHNSLDPLCLSIQAYLNLTGVKWVVNESDCNISPTGELPLLKVNTEPITGTWNIVKVLKQRGHDLDDSLSQQQVFETQGFIALLEEKMYDALLYTWYLENENYLKLTNPTMSNHLSYLNRYLLPQQMRDRVRTRLAKYKIATTGKGKENQVYQMARECYRALADKLGEKDFFFGSKYYCLTRPTTLDAFAFGHLALHCYPSLAIPKLFSILTFEFPQLIAYVERMKELVYKQPLVKSPNVRPRVTEVVRDFLKNPDQYIGWFMDGFQTKIVTEKTKEERVEQFWRGLTVVGAVGFFLGFVIKQGIIQFEDEIVD